MNTGEILLTILIPIAALLLAAILLIGIKSYMLISKKKIIESLESDLNIERLQQADATISRVDSIARNNNEYRSVFESLENQYQKLEDVLVRAEEQIKILKDKKMKKKEFNETRTMAMALLESASAYNKNFNTISSQVTQQDDFLSMEATYLSANLRKAIHVFIQKRIVLDSIAPKIENHSNRIKKIGDEFKELLGNAENKLASLKLSEYSREIQQFTKVVSEAPKIDTYLKTMIPNSIKKLTNKYKETKELLNSNMSNIKFKDSIVSLSSDFNIAIDSFNNLKMDVAKTKIKRMLTILSSLDDQISYERSSYDFVNAHYEETVVAFKKVKSSFNSVSQKIDKIIGAGKVIPNNLNTSFELLKEKTDNLVVAFEEMKTAVNNKEILYSQKISKMKFVIQKSNATLEILNEVIEMVWNVNVEISVTKNKYSKFESAINEILSNTKRLKMKLNPELKGEYAHISSKMSMIAKRLEENNVSDELKHEVEQLSKEISSFYSVVNGNLQICEIFNNLIGEFGPRRRIDQKLNIVFSNAEKEYLDGNYSSALDMVISGLEGKTK